MQEDKKSEQEMNLLHTPLLRSRRLRKTHRLIDDKLSAALHFLEIFLALVTVVFVVLGVIRLLSDIPHINELLVKDGIHTALQEVLSDVLLLVVGVELAIMLVRRTPESLVEVIFFVIARKMLIKTDAFYELFIGVAAIACLFAIRKYLVASKPSSDMGVEE
jgi:hypothetical protein